MEETLKAEKKVKSIPVRILSTTGPSALVEWVSGKAAVSRATIPVDKVVDGKVDETTLSAGIPYGIPWDELQLHSFTSAEFQTAMHSADIWTKEDLYHKPNEALAAIKNLQNAQLGAMLEFAAKYEGG